MQFILERIVANTLIGIPLASLYFGFALTLCGFKDKIKRKPFITIVIIQTIIDVVSTITLREKYGIDTGLLYLLLGAINISIILKIDLLSSIICNIVSTLVTFIITQLPIYIIMAILLGISYDELMVLTNKNTFYFVSLAYVCFAITSLLLILVYKKNIKIVNLEKHKIFDRIIKSSKINNGIILLAFILIPAIIFLALNFMIFYFYNFNQKTVSSFAYLATNSLAIIISSILMFILFNKIIALRHYKTEFESQQKYIHDIDELLKNLRTQKHGFINHMNTLLGLITLEDYAKAEEYIKDMQHTITSKCSLISVGDSALNALLNVKAKTAENNNINFEVNANETLDKMNIRMFEISEAIGNVVDNALEATSVLEEKYRLVKINLSSNEKYYIFEVQNTGKTIPPHVIDKMFDQSFTTKDKESGEHGFGLYITKIILSYSNGKIEVQSKNNLTSFKIYIPKGNKNVKKRSVG